MRRGQVRRRKMRRRERGVSNLIYEDMLFTALDELELASEVHRLLVYLNSTCVPCILNILHLYCVYSDKFASHFGYHDT